MTAALFSPPDAPPPLLTDLTDVIRAASAGAPRSQQRSIGPSGVGNPCDRAIAYQLLHVDPVNPSGDPLPSVVGTATHAWLADAFFADNAARTAAGQPMRWLVEQRLQVRPGLYGSCDLFDLATLTVIDWKLPGATRFAKYRKGDIGGQYHSQIHLYGRGWENVGITPKRVAIAFLPRGGMLANAHVWTEPYRPEVADAALERLDRVLIAAATLNVDDHPTRMGLIPSDTSLCTFCDFFRPGEPADLGGCPGWTEVPTS